MSKIKANRYENTATTDGGIDIDTSGSVGIGTASPVLSIGSVSGKVLHVAGAGTTGARFQNTSGTSIEFFAGSDAIINTGTSTNMAFKINDTEQMRIDSSGRLLVGTSSQIGSSSAGNAFLQIKGRSGGAVGRLTLATTNSNPGANSTIGSIYFTETSGGNYGLINCVSDGTSGTNDYPGRLTFSTTADGASSPTERLRIDSSGHLNLVSGSSTLTNLNFTENQLNTYARIEGGKSGSGVGDLRFHTYSGGLSEAMRIDSSGRVGIGTTSPTKKLEIHDGSGTSAQVVKINSGGVGLLTIQSGTTYESRIEFGSSDNDDAGYIYYDNDDDVMKFGINGSERMRLTSGGQLLFGKTTVGVSGVGAELRHGSNDYSVVSTSDGHTSLLVARNNSDGTLVQFRHDNSTEGSISVSGSTVSYNGGHLARWSQLASGAARTEILRGSVLSNLDEMCEWGEEDNEQLNRMQVSDVEGDKNVSGVFQAWDDDDDTYVNDFYCAMTGDFVIRIAQGTTVARGDLLMSAGDGTAKPQDDDIVRSKTIAKVTSTTVSTTYSDNSYCVPCVLMAC